MEEEFFEIDYDVVIGCYVFWYMGEGICLMAKTHREAIEEAEQICDA